MDEIVRCVEALQLSYEKSIAVSICIFVSNTFCTSTFFSFVKQLNQTPANWPNNHADIELPDGTRSTEFKGSVFLLPTVSPEEAALHYPGYHSCKVPSGKEYLRLVKKDEV
jgi:1-Cys peroxiredoxin 6